MKDLERGGERLVLIHHVFTVSIPAFNKQAVQHFTQSHDLHIIGMSQSTALKMCRLASFQLL